MPRTSRASVGGICYHVINRGNARREVFCKEGDYQAFLKAIGHACIEIAMPVLGYCLMPNHFHFVVWPKNDGDLSRWMHWVLNTFQRTKAKIPRYFIFWTKIHNLRKSSIIFPNGYRNPLMMK